jgi:hypothetical protein
MVPGWRRKYLFNEINSVLLSRQKMGMKTSSPYLANVISRDLTALGHENRRLWA